jgi:hypothetical protein
LGRRWWRCAVVFITLSAVHNSSRVLQARLPQPRGIGSLPKITTTYHQAWYHCTKDPGPSVYIRDPHKKSRCRSCGVQVCLITSLVKLSFRVHVFALTRDVEDPVHPGLVPRWRDSQTTAGAFMHSSYQSCDERGGLERRSYLQHQRWCRSSASI